MLRGDQHQRLLVEEVQHPQLQWHQQRTVEQFSATSGQASSNSDERGVSDSNHQSRREKEVEFETSIGNRCQFRETEQFEWSRDT